MEAATSTGVQVCLVENHLLAPLRCSCGRANLCILVNRILSKYGDPPDLQDSAVRTVIRQVVALSATWGA